MFEEASAQICESGMHFCALPHQVFEFYAAGQGNEFTEVEALDEVHTDDEQKYCTKRLRIGAKISVFDICKISVSAFFERFDFTNKIQKAKESTENNAGDCGAANAGNYGAANAGDYGAAIVQSKGTASVGEKGVAISMGNESKAKGSIGALLVLIERDNYDNIISAKTLIVDDKDVKSDTYYMLKDGIVAEV